ncbi:MAG: methyltransferase, partial [Antricoccus sp.]
PMPDDGADILDLGCGYGAIAAVAARRGPSTHVVAVDINERARDLTARNAQRSELSNIEVCSPSDVAADRAYDRIYSNPPIRIGKPALRALLLHWLTRLRDDGIAYLVVGKHLGADSLATWLSGAGFAVERLAAKNSFRIITVTKEHR